MLGVGLIGLGMIADTHVLAISSSSNCYLRGAFDSVPGKAEAFAAKNGGIAYDSLEAMLSDPEISIISITTPSGFHLEPALEAARHGKNLLIEKPIEVTYERARQIIDAAKESGVLVSGVFQSRFQEAARIVKDAIDKGRFGRIVLADAYIKWYRSQEYYDSGAWRGTWKIDGGGALMNQGIHAIDLLQWFMGKAVSVSASTATLAHERIEVEDVGAAVVRFENGAIGVIEGTTGAYPGSPKRIEIRGTDGSAVLEEDSITEWSFRDSTEEDAEILRRFASASSAGGSNDPKAISYTGHLREYEDFADAIMTGRRPFITGEDAAESVRLIECIYQSARSGSSVAL